jgi:hypothetical protein
MATASRKRTTTKSTKKRPAKKRAAAAKPRSKPNGKKTKGKDTGPLELVIKSELTKFKLQAAELVFEKENKRVIDDIQQKFAQQLSRAQRNDPAWLKASKVRKVALNELITKQTDALPDGYMISNINPTAGTYTAIYDPEKRGTLAE